MSDEITRREFVKGTVAATAVMASASADLMHAVVAPESGLRTAKRISHVYLMDVPDYPRPLLVTDTATGEPLFLARVANPATS